MTDADVRWVATLSNGDTAVEHVGEYKVEEGKRLPWVRLTKFAAENGLHLTSLRLNFRGRTIHMPRMNFDRFSLNDKSIAPIFYSLQYILEGDVMGGMDPTYFVDLVAHYPKFDVHYIQDVTDGNNSWVTVTEDFSPPAPSPIRK